MSLSGIRDISALNAPPGRQEIETKLGYREEYDLGLARSSASRTAAADLFHNRAPDRVQPERPALLSRDARCATATAAMPASEAEQDIFRDVEDVPQARRPSRTGRCRRPT